MTPLRNRKPHARPCAEEPCAGRFARTCCRAAIIAASYQIFSLGAGTLIDRNPQLLVRREDDRKTVIERVATSVSSTLEEPVYGWCLCAHLGQRGPGGGGGSTIPTCIVCMGAIGGNVAPPAAAPQPQVQQPNESQEEERERQALEEKRKETERRQTQEFEERKQRALAEFKGVAGGDFDMKGLPGDTGLKGLDTAGGLSLKDINTDTSVVDLRDKKEPYKVDLAAIKGMAPQLRPLVADLPEAVAKRTGTGNNAQALEILRSFEGSPLAHPVKSMKELTPGDVILIAPDYLRSRGRDEDVSHHLYEWGLSNGINWLDRKGSNNPSSPASHAIVFLGKRNGKNWYLDNTYATGPVIKDAKAFLQEYGHRSMDVATLVGQPLSAHEGQELWKGAHELRNNASYGIKMLQYNGNDVMVCSEALEVAARPRGPQGPRDPKRRHEDRGCRRGPRQEAVRGLQPVRFLRAGPVLYHPSPDAQVTRAERWKGDRVRHKGVISLFCLMVAFAPLLAYSADPAGEQLAQYVSELGRNPNDAALREKIIRHAQTMATRPRCSGRGEEGHGTRKDRLRGGEDGRRLQKSRP